MGDLFGDDIDLDRAASAFPDISLDGSGDIPLPAAPSVRQDSGFSFDFDAAPPIRKETVVKVTGDDEIDKFENEFPEIDVPQQQQPPSQSRPTFNTTPTFAPKPQPSLYSVTPILNQRAEEEEPEVIKQWREKQQEEIKARDEASKARRQEAVSKAEHAIDGFYEDYARKKEKNIRENKDQEEEYLASLTEKLSAGTTWERICELIELQNSQSKTIGRTGPGTSELGRFKDVLLRLKRQGDAAPGAAGY
ncbi:clathrin light chain-domain-containing protein [Amanita rubescens]|nr:clathrin light chain-domain-containing protein [Amanita rubescens]